MKVKTNTALAMLGWFLLAFVLLYWEQSLR